MLGLCQTGSSTDKHLELDLSNEEGILTGRKLSEVDILGCDIKRVQFVNHGSELWRRPHHELREHDEPVVEEHF